MWLDGIAKVYGPRSINAWWGIRTNWRRAIWHMESAWLCWKDPLTPSLKIPLWSPCSPHSHRELPGHWTSKKKRSPLEQEHQGFLGSIDQVSMGWGWARPQQHCYLGGATSPLYQSLNTDLDPLVSFSQILLRGVPVQLLELCFGNPLPKVAYRLFFTSFSRLRNRK